MQRSRHVLLISLLASAGGACLLRVSDRSPDAGPEVADGGVAACLALPDAGWDLEIFESGNEDGGVRLRTALGLALADAGILVADASGQLVDVNAATHRAALAASFRENGCYTVGPWRVATGPGGAIYVSGVALSKTCTNEIGQVTSDGGFSEIAVLTSPTTSIAADAQGIYVVGPASSKLFRVLLDGGVDALTSGFDVPSAIALDNDGGIFVSDRCGISRVALATGATRQIVDGGALCDGGPFVGAMAVAPSGTLYALALLGQEAQFLRVESDGQVATLATLNPCSGLFGEGLAATSTDLFFGGGEWDDGGGGWIGDLHLRQGSL